MGLPGCIRVPWEPCVWAVCIFAIPSPACLFLFASQGQALSSSFPLYLSIARCFLQALTFNSRPLRLGREPVHLFSRTDAQGRAMSTRHWFLPPVTCPGSWEAGWGLSVLFQSSIVLLSLRLRNCELLLAPQRGLSLMRHLEILLWEQKIR